MWRVYDKYGEPLRHEFTSESTAWSFIALAGRMGEWEPREVHNAWCISSFRAKRIR